YFSYILLESGSAQVPTRARAHQGIAGRLGVPGELEIDAVVEETHVDTTLVLRRALRAEIRVFGVRQRDRAAVAAPDDLVDRLEQRLGGSRRRLLPGDTERPTQPHGCCTATQEEPRRTHLGVHRNGIRAAEPARCVETHRASEKKLIPKLHL